MTMVNFAILAAADAVLTLPLLWGLIVLSAIDIRTYTLPDAITLPLLLCGLVLSVFGFGPPLLESVAGSIIGYASLASIAFAYRSLRGRDGLGLGDAKLLGMLGAWIGVSLLPEVLLIAALLGLACYIATHAFRRQLHATDAVPFGPFLAISGYCVLLGTRQASIATGLCRTVTQLPCY